MSVRRSRRLLALLACVATLLPAAPAHASVAWLPFVSVYMSPGLTALPADQFLQVSFSGGPPPGVVTCMTSNGATYAVTPTFAYLAVEATSALPETILGGVGTTSWGYLLLFGEVVRHHPGVDDAVFVGGEASTSLHGYYSRSGNALRLFLDAQFSLDPDGYSQPEPAVACSTGLTLDVVLAPGTAGWNVGSGTLVSTVGTA